MNAQSLQYAKVIKENRKKLGWSQKQLADKIHTSQQAIARWEQGITEPRTDNLNMLSKALGVPISHFIDRESYSIDSDFKSLYSSLTPSDKEKTLDYMKLLKRQEVERDEFK